MSVDPAEDRRAALLARVSGTLRAFAKRHDLTGYRVEQLTEGAVSARSWTSWTSVDGPREPRITGLILVAQTLDVPLAGLIGDIGVGTDPQPPAQRYLCDVRLVERILATDDATQLRRLLPLNVFDVAVEVPEGAKYLSPEEAHAKAKAVADHIKAKAPKLAREVAKAVSLCIRITESRPWLGE